MIESMVWAPGMTYPPHDHRTEVIAGAYSGIEVNEFFHKVETSEGAELANGCAVVIGTGEAVLMKHDAIHRGSNPDRRRFTAAFHIYMGDYLHSTRSIRHPDGALEAPASLQLTEDIFAATDREFVLAEGNLVRGIVRS